MVLAENRIDRPSAGSGAHHHCLGSRGSLPYSAVRGQQSVNRESLDELKRQIRLADYLQAHGWHPAQKLAGGRWMGSCPFHRDHKPSFLVDPGKNLFYCYGCGCGGDVIRFAELYHQVKFPEALRLLRQWQGAPTLLQAVVDFYRIQLHRHGEAVAYLCERGVRSPELIEHMRIGYAPGGCLRAGLLQLGFTASALREAGLVTAADRDVYSRRIIFPLESNLYGRSISRSAPPHRLLRGSKGGLYGWQQVRNCPEVILVEGLFDYAVLWQSGFRNVSCSLGTHLNAQQFRQLCDGTRAVYLTFDADANGSGQDAAESLVRRLQAHGITTHRVRLPDGHDPNSFFVRGGDAQQFEALLEVAQS